MYMLMVYFTFFFLSLVIQLDNEELMRFKIPALMKV